MVPSVDLKPELQGPEGHVEVGVRVFVEPHRVIRDPAGDVVEGRMRAPFGWRPGVAAGVAQQTSDALASPSVRGQGVRLPQLIERDAAAQGVVDGWCAEFGGQIDGGERAAGDPQRADHLDQPARDRAPTECETLPAAATAGCGEGGRLLVEPPHEVRRRAVRDHGRRIGEVQGRRAHPHVGTRAGVHAPKRGDHLARLEGEVNLAAEVPVVGAADRTVGVQELLEISVHTHR